MSSSLLIKNILLLFLVVILQILIFNQLIFLHAYYPMIYILWIYYAPTEKNPFLVLILSFFLGFFIDLFLSTGGIHTFASVLITYLRKPLSKFISSSKFEVSSYLIFPWPKRILFLFLFILIHHSVLFLLDNFKISNILNQIQKLYYTLILSMIFNLLFIYLFESKKEK